MSIKKGTKFSPVQKENIAANYRKLWLKLKVDAPFMLQVTKIQVDWNIPKDDGGENAFERTDIFYQELRLKDEDYFSSDEFKKIAPILKSVFELELPKKVKMIVFRSLLCNLPSYKFKEEIRALQEKFDFEEFWIQSLAMYVITDRIYPPYEKESNDCPSVQVIEDWKIFLLTSQKKAQHDFLKKQGLTTKQISELKEDTNELPRKLIHSNLNIAQEVWGDWDDISKDKNMVNRVKKRYERFSKFFVSLTNEDMEILKNLNLSSRKT